jgi:hypothetical protein
MKTSELISLRYLVGLEVEIHTDHTIHSGKLQALCPSRKAFVRIGPGVSMQRKSGKIWQRGATEISASPIRAVQPVQAPMVNRFGPPKRKAAIQ